MTSDRPISRTLAALAVALSLAACSPDPTPVEPTPAPEDEPAPQAAVAEPTQLRDAINAPLEQARAVEDTLQHSADAQAAAIEAAEGSAADTAAAGEAPPQ